MVTAVIVTAAGRGARMKAGNKLLLDLYGMPVLARSLDLFQRSRLIQKIIITAPLKYLKDYKKLVEKYKISKVEKIIRGALTRQESVYRALRELSDVDFVAVHDGARPLIKAGLLEKLVKEAKKYKAVIPVVMAKDTVKVLSSDSFIRKTLRRESIFLAQTPQVFEYALIMKAYNRARKYKIKATDDSMLVEKIKKVKAIEGDYGNIKITFKEDLILAEEILKKR